MCFTHTYRPYAHDVTEQKVHPPMKARAYHCNIHQQMQTADLSTLRYARKSTMHVCEVYVVHAVYFTVCLQTDVVWCQCTWSISYTKINKYKLSKLTFSTLKMHSHRSSPIHYMSCTLAFVNFQKMVHKYQNKTTLLHILFFFTVYTC